MNQMAFDDLFIEQETKKVPSTSPLHEKIIKLLELDILSVLSMCESLIQEGLISKERYSSTGKPKEYPKVCLVLDEMVQQGVVELVEDKERKDRIYRLINSKSKA